MSKQFISGSVVINGNANVYSSGSGGVLKSMLTLNEAIIDVKEG